MASNKRCECDISSYYDHPAGQCQQQSYAVFQRGEKVLALCTSCELPGDKQIEK